MSGFIPIVARRDNVSSIVGIMATRLTPSLIGNYIFSPLQYLPVAWFDASDLTTVIESSNIVSQWNDKSNNGNHATQETESLRPSTSIETLNELNVLTSNGTDYMSFPCSIDPTKPIYTFIVAKYNSNSNVNYDYVKSSTGYRIVQNQSTIGRNSGGGLQTNAHASYAITNNMAVLFSGFHINSDSNEFYGYENSDLYFNATVGSDFTDGELTLGSLFDDSTGGNGIDGYIAEYIVYNTPLLQSQISQIESYLLNKWMPIPLLHSSILWLDSHDPTTITESDGKVSQWSDKSGLENHATQGSGSWQPTYNSEENSIDFDLHTLVLASTVTINNCHIFIVAKKSQSVGYGAILGHSTSHTEFRLNSSKILEIYGDPSIWNNEISSTTAATDPTLFEFVAKASGELYVNGNLEDSGGNQSSNVYIDTLGSYEVSSNIFIGSIYEIIIFSSQLSAENVQIVRSYLNNKWSLY